MWTFPNARKDSENFFWSRKDSNYLDITLEVFRRDDSRDIRQVKNLTRGEEDFSQFMQLRNQLDIAAEKMSEDENLSPLQIPTFFKDMDEQLRRAHNFVDVMERANRKVCATLLRYKVDRLESSYAQVQLLAGKNEDEKFQRIVYMNYKLEEVIYLLDVNDFSVWVSYH